MRHTILCHICNTNFSFTTFKFIVSLKQANETSISVAMCSNEDVWKFLCFTVIVYMSKMMHVSSPGKKKNKEKPVHDLFSFWKFINKLSITYRMWFNLKSFNNPFYQFLFKDHDPRRLLEVSTAACVWYANLFRNKTFDITEKNCGLCKDVLFRLTHFSYSAKHPWSNLFTTSNEPKGSQKIRTRQCK